MITTPSCPYPWCSTSEFRAGALSTAAVASCEGCGSLAVRCPERSCLTWNRAFIPWCRRCGQALGEALSAWEALRTLDPPGGMTSMGAPETAADLSEIDGPAKSRSHRVAIAPAQGFLALHQAGGFVALIRPFAPADRSLAYHRRGAAPDAPSRVGPAYEPAILPGGRRLLLSDRRALAVLDLWDTPISTAAPSDHALLRLEPPGPIAAAPIPLGGAQVGLLLGGPSAYSWLVWDVLAAPGGARSPIPLDRIVGGPCEFVRASADVLAFATPRGHWAWRVEDALAGDADAIVPTWTADRSAPPPQVDSVRVEIDRRASNPEAFSRPGQVFQADPGSGQFHWHFRTSDGLARSYRVLPGDLATDDRVEYRDSTPVGVATETGRPRGSVILEQNGRLMREREIRGELSPCQAALPQEGGAGLQLVGDLIVTIRNPQGEARSRRIEVQPLRDGRPPLRTEPVVGLASDPLIWSGWLFTVERPDAHQLVLRRRNLSGPRGAPP